MRGWIPACLAMVGLVAMACGAEPRPERRSEPWERAIPPRRVEPIRDPSLPPGWEPPPPRLEGPFVSGSDGLEVEWTRRWDPGSISDRELVAAMEFATGVVGEFARSLGEPTEPCVDGPLEVAIVDERELRDQLPGRLLLFVDVLGMFHTDGANHVLFLAAPSPSWSTLVHELTHFYHFRNGWKGSSERLAERSEDFLRERWSGGAAGIGPHLPRRTDQTSAWEDARLRSVLSRPTRKTRRRARCDHR